MANLATFNAAMKTQFKGPIRDMLSSNKVLLFGQRTRNATDETKDPRGTRDWRGIIALSEDINFVGNGYQIPLRTSRNQGVGLRAELATLPAPGAQGYNFITDNLKYAYGLFSITGQVLKASESNEGAFARIVSSEMKGVTDDLKRAVNIQAFGNRDANGNSPMATITSGVASATQTIDSSLWFQGGEFIDIYDPTGVTRRNAAGALSVTSITRGTTPQLVLSATITTTTNDIIVRASSDSVSATPNNDIGQSMNGIQNIVASAGVLHGLNPASVPLWKSSVVAAGGAVVGETLLRQLVDSVGFESGSDEEMVGIWTRGQRTRYAALLQSQKRFNDMESVTLRGGFKAILFDDMAMVVDDHCPTGQTFFLNTDALYWAQLSDWEWGDEDGDPFKWVSRTDSYIAYMYKYFNLGTTARNRHGKITGGADDNK